MHKTAVAYAVGKLLQIMGLALMAPLVIAIFDYSDESIIEILSHAEVVGYLLAIFLALFSGTLFTLIFRHGKNLQGVKEGFATVTVGWIALTLVSSIPMTLYFIEQHGGDWTYWFLSFTNAFFETMSGFTTTGATILRDIEALPNSLLFLRALSHWLGGMGIITMAIAIFPAMGVSGYQMFRSEVTGPTKEKLQPRLAQTVSVLWGVYVVLTLIETIVLLAAGMNFFEAICHSFSTIATGGFSPRDASIAAYNSPLIEWIIIIFMFIAGINFLLHFRAMRGDFKLLLSDPESKFYFRLVTISIITFAAVLFFNGLVPLEVAEDRYRFNYRSHEQFSAHYLEQQEKIQGLEPSLRTAAFQVTSIATGTGFVTADYSLWSDFLRIGLVLLMFAGGCAGSTTGGLKMIRILVLAKTVIRELRKLAQPRLVSPIKLAGEIIADSLVTNIVSFVLLFLALFIFFGLLLTLFIPNVETAFTASLATLANIGPGLADIGAIEHYGWMALPAKWICIVAMLLGRLEIFTVLILLRFKTWKK